MYQIEQTMRRLCSKEVKIALAEATKLRVKQMEDSSCSFCRFEHRAVTLIKSPPLLL